MFKKKNKNRKNEEKRKDIFLYLTHHFKGWKSKIRQSHWFVRGHLLGPHGGEEERETGMCMDAWSDKEPERQESQVYPVFLCLIVQN